MSKTYEQKCSHFSFTYSTFKIRVMQLLLFDAWQRKDSNKFAHCTVTILLNNFVHLSYSFTFNVGRRTQCKWMQNSENCICIKDSTLFNQVGFNFEVIRDLLSKL